MNCTFHDGYYYIRVPGAVLYARNRDLLWPSYMALVIHYPEVVRKAEANNETLWVKCVD